MAPIARDHSREVQMVQHSGPCLDSQDRTSTSSAASVHPEANIAQLIDFDNIQLPTDVELRRLATVRRKILHSHRSKIWSRVREQAQHSGNKIYSRRASFQQLRNRVHGNHAANVVSHGGHANLFEVHLDNQLPPDYLELGPVWDTSGVHPGHPRYGYKQDGTPIGSEYIAYMNASKAAAAGGRQPGSVHDLTKAQLTSKQLRQAGWSRTKNASQHGLKWKKLSVSEARRHNLDREEEELRMVQNFYPELELELE